MNPPIPHTSTFSSSQHLKQPLIGLVLSTRRGDDTKGGLGERHSRGGRQWEDGGGHDAHVRWELIGK